MTEIQDKCVKSGGYGKDGEAGAMRKQEPPRGPLLIYHNRVQRSIAERRSHTLRVDDRALMRTPDEHAARFSRSRTSKHTNRQQGQEQ
jgi:hypothetical protein